MTSMSIPIIMIIIMFVIANSTRSFAIVMSIRIDQMNECADGRFVTDGVVVLWINRNRHIVDGI